MNDAAPPSRVVVDTNVLVAALLTPGKVADLALTDLLASEVVILVDDRILAEYREVLARPKFSKVPREAIAERIARMEVRATPVTAGASTIDVADEDDRPFVEVALAGGAQAIVTGNAKHFPTGLGFEVISPGRWLELRSTARRTDG